MYVLARQTEFYVSCFVLRIGNHVFTGKINDRFLTNQSADSNSVILLK